MDELPPPLNDKQLYDYYYVETRKLNTPRHRFWQRKICGAKMHGYNPPVWVSVVEGQGIIGSFATEEEANQRAFCAAMMFEDEKSGKLGRIKKLLDQRSWTRATDADSESQGEELPVSENIAEKEIGTASDASHEKVARAQDVPLNGPRIVEPMSDESPEERLDANHVEEHSVYTTEGEIMARQAIVDATLQAVVGPSSKPGIDDINANDPKPIVTNAASIAGFSGANPHVSPHALGDTHLEYSGALKRPASALTAQIGDSSANRPIIATAAAQSAPVAQGTGKRNESGQGTEENQLSSLNKRKIDGSTSDAPKKQRVVPVLPSGFNTKAVEMRNPVSGVIEKTFPNAAEASKANYINVTKLMEICRHGGGLIGTHLFRYIEPSEDDAFLLTRASKSAREARVEPIPDGPLSNVPATSARPPAVLGHRPAPTIPLVTRHNSYKNNSGSNNNTNNNTNSNSNNNTEEVVNTTKASPPIKLAVAPASKRNKRVLPLESGRVTQQQVATRPAATAAKATTGRAQKPLPGPFDLSTLLPIRRNLKPPLKPRHTIELVELRTLKVLVCFRGTTDASRALGLDRKAISGACESYSKTRPITFGTYTLRYAQAGRYSAYVYGDDAKDYVKHRKETHADTAARFKRIFEANQKDGTLGTRPIIKPDKVLDTPDEVTVEEEVEINAVDGGLDAFTLCIVCQEVPPSIVFEPCYHAVVCRACAGIACKSFCPACQTRIQGRVEPKMAILVRPRIYSAYSFM